MMEKELFAVRTLRLCTKDCLCLYVCPTGATDTENSVIDKEKCTGCGVCAVSCPSSAISMVPYTMPPQQEHRSEVVDAMKAVFRSKAQQEALATALSDVLASALAKSARIQAEDIIREAGYMLPQSSEAQAILNEIASNASLSDEARTSAQKLLELLAAPNHH